MKFDEALEDISALSLNETVGLSPKVVNIIINKLREEYAPTVEMTKYQYEILASSRNNAVNRIDKVGIMEFMSAYALLDLEIDHLSLMQAWLHPETIKVVDE